MVGSRRRQLPDDGWTMEPAGRLAHSDLIAGRTVLYIDTISAIPEQIRAGNVRAVAVSTRNRSRALPNVPTAEEQGLKG